MVSNEEIDAKADEDNDDDQVFQRQEKEDQVIRTSQTDKRKTRSAQVCIAPLWHFRNTFILRSLGRSQDSLEDETVQTSFGEIWVMGARSSRHRGRGGHRLGCVTYHLRQEINSEVFGFLAIFLCVSSSPEIVRDSRENQSSGRYLQEEVNSQLQLPL